MGFKMTKRRREVLAHIAGDYGTVFRLYRVAIPGKQWRADYGRVDKWTMAGVDVTEIVNHLARAKLVRLWYKHPSEIARAGYTVQRCLCITDKGIEELLWPTI